MLVNKPYFGVGGCTLKFPRYFTKIGDPKAGSGASQYLMIWGCFPKMKSAKCGPLLSKIFRFQGCDLFLFGNERFPTSVCVLVQFSSRPWNSMKFRTKTYKDMMNRCRILLARRICRLCGLIFSPLSLRPTDLSHLGRWKYQHSLLESSWTIRFQGPTKKWGKTAFRK